jgi:hypothetical protein
MFGAKFWFTTRSRETRVGNLSGHQEQEEEVSAGVFCIRGMSITGLEQNPDTKSNWAKMAREGIKVMQFIHDGKYIAVDAAGKVTLYGKRTGLTNKTKRLAD